MTRQTKDLLNKRIGDAQPPTAIPTGKWLFEIDDCGVKAATGRAWYNLTPISPVADVDESELEVYLEEGPLKDKSVFRGFDLSDRRDEFANRKFIEGMGIDAAELIVGEIKKLAGVRFYAEVTHSANKDGGTPWVNIRGVEPYDEQEEEAEPA